MQCSKQKKIRLAPHFLIYVSLCQVLFWTLLRQWKQVYLPENWVLVKISGVFKNSGPNFWHFPWVLHFLCSKLILFLPEKWVLQPKILSFEEKVGWVLKFVEFWWSWVFEKMSKKKPELDTHSACILGLSCYPHLHWVWHFSSVFLKREIPA